jgi:hypothetical protein
MDKISGWRLGHHEAKICGKCGMKESDSGCCKDKYAVFKISIDQNKTTFPQVSFLFYIRIFTLTRLYSMLKLKIRR